MADPQTDSQNTPKADAPKPRSPVERAIVWGGILILVGIALYEYQSRSSHKNSFNDLTAALDAAERGDASLTDAEVPKLVSGFSKHEKNEPVDRNPFAATRMDKYAFSGLMPATREIYVYYGAPGRDGKGREVLAVMLEPVKPNDDKSANPAQPAGTP